MKQLVIIASIALMLVVVGCAPSGVPPEPSPPGSEDTLVGQAFQPGIVLPEDYSPPWDIATGGMKFTTTPEGFSDITSGVSFGLAANGDAIYYQGYYHNYRTGRWVPFEYDGPRLMVDGVATNWIEDTATSTLDFASPFDLFRSGGENYVLAYICDWDAGWHCGPRELGDTTHRWTIQSFSLCGEGTVVDGETCRAVSGAISEVCSNGADDDHNGDVDCDDAACSNDAACTGEVPASAPTAGAPTCVDTDGGNNPETAGIVNASGLRTPLPDSCGTRDGQMFLTERFCRDATEVLEDIDCASIDPTYTCLTQTIEHPEYGTISGAGYCGLSTIAPAITLPCEDSDIRSETVIIAGKPINGALVTAGKVTLADGSEWFDTCVDGQTINETKCKPEGTLYGSEYRCTGIDPSYTCIQGSTGGAYCGAPLACVDTDGGNNPETAGIMYSPQLTTPAADSCGTQADGKVVLTERFCRDTGIDAETIDCTSIDLKYVCLTQRIEHPEYGTFERAGYCGLLTADVSCVDTDGGKNSEVAGTVTAPSLASPAADSCYTPPTGTMYLIEKYCAQANDVSQIGVVCADIDPSYMCIVGPEGAYCGASPAPASAPACQDTDGGPQLGWAGTVTVVDGATRTDACAPNAPNLITEYVCDATSATGIRGTDYPCTNLGPNSICFEGPEGAFCGTPPTPTTASTCVDSDAGAKDVRIVGGKVTLADGSETFDACTDVRVLNEMYCAKDGTLDVVGYPCTDINPDYTCIPSPNGAFCG